MTILKGLDKLLHILADHSVCLLGEVVTQDADERLQIVDNVLVGQEVVKIDYFKLSLKHYK